MIGDSIAFLAAGGKRSCTTPSISPTRGATARALECLSAAVDAGAENVTLCDTANGARGRHEVGEATAGVVDA